MQLSIQMVVAKTRKSKMQNIKKIEAASQCDCTVDCYCR